MPPAGGFNLERFVGAQDPVYSLVLEELRAGRKRSHWMWFIFPQVRGLGASATSQRYALASKDAASAYWTHPILGSRLSECTEAVLNLEGRTAAEIFGYPDVLKFCSCMTLFEASVADGSLFRAALLKYFAGEPDRATQSLLNAAR